MTTYTYDRLINLGPQIVRLRPAPHCRTPIVSYSLKVSPQDHFVNWQQDPHSNFQARFVFPKQMKSMHIEVDLVAEMTVINPFDFFVEQAAEKYPFQYDESLLRDLRPFMEMLPLEKEGKAFLKTIERKPMGTVDFLVALNRPCARRDQLHDSHGAGRSNNRRDAQAAARLVSRFSLAVRANGAAVGFRGAFCFGLSHSIDCRRQEFGWTIGARE